MEEYVKISLKQYDTLKNCKDAIDSKKYVKTIHSYYAGEVFYSSAMESDVVKRLNKDISDLKDVIEEQSREIERLKKKKRWQI